MDECGIMKLSKMNVFSDTNSSSSTSGQINRCPAPSSSSCDRSRSSSQNHNHNHNKTFERTFRRKWILEKWLVWITFLVTSILLDSAYGSVMCYECAWQGSTSLPSTAEVNDVCRPHNFNVDVVHKIKCGNGCKIQALYESDSSSAKPEGGLGPSANNTNSSRTSLEKMTFYFRGCQEDKKTRESCENKSYINHVTTLECFCLTDYCNGEQRSGADEILPLTFFQLFTSTDKSAPNKFEKIQTLALFYTNILELSVLALLLNNGLTSLFQTVKK